MDSGEEIQGLDEGWTLLGAKLMEWAAGFCAFMVASEVLFGGKIGGNMPYLIGIWVFSTVSLARLRLAYPDEERGIANHVLTLIGFCPPNMPAPAVLQPRWSGAPVKKLKDDSFFVRLGLDNVFPVEEERDELEVAQYPIRKGKQEKVNTR